MTISVCSTSQKNQNTSDPQLINRIQQLETQLLEAKTTNATLKQTFDHKLYQQALQSEQLFQELSQTKQQLITEQSLRQRLTEEISLLNQENNALREKNTILTQKVTNYEQSLPLLIEQLKLSNERSTRLEDKILQIEQTIAALQKTTLDKDLEIKKLKLSDPCESLLMKGADVLKWIALQFTHYEPNKTHQ